MCLKGYLYGLATEREAAMVAAACAATAAALPATSRERAIAGPRGARRRPLARSEPDLEAVAIESPRDALALQTGHQIDFFTGTRGMLRDRIAAALPSWDAAMPGYHAILGMHAFGLEETGDYAAAEAAGRRAVELEPRDGWAQHAVAHVMEMQSRPQDGIAWMRAIRSTGREGSFLQVHNWWHLALFHYDLGDSEAVLTLYDGPIFGAPSPRRSTWSMPRRSCGGSISAAFGRPPLGRARRQLGGKGGGAGNYAFNDVHAMMAFVGAGWTAAAAALLEAQRAGHATAATTMRLHPGCRPSADARRQGVRRWRLWRSRAPDPADAGASPTGSAAATPSATSSI